MPEHNKGTARWCSIAEKDGRQSSSNANARHIFKRVLRVVPNSKVSYGPNNVISFTCSICCLLCRDLVGSIP
jgi:hypothetical protein